MFEVNRLSDATIYLLDKPVAIFDLDDTLYSEKEYIRSGFYEVAQYNPTVKEMEKKLWSAFESGKRAIDFVLNSEGIYSKEKAEKCLEVYRRHFPRISLYPEAKNMLQELKENNVRLGIITDGRPEGQRAKIAALGIEDLFEKIIITDELGGTIFRKPSSVAYEIMQAHFAVPYNQMVYIGDNDSKDFLAPLQLGMECIFFKNPDGLYVFN